MFSSLVNSLKKVVKSYFQPLEIANVLNYECKNPELEFLNAMYAYRTKRSMTDIPVEKAA